MRIRMGRTVAGTIRRHVPRSRGSPRCSTTSPSTSARRPTTRRRCCAASPTCRPTTASGTRSAARGRSRWRWRGSPRELGVEMRTGCGVRRIAGRGRPGRGRRDRRRRARSRSAAVVSNMDSVRTHRELIGGRSSDALHQAPTTYEPACSGVVLYLGLDRSATTTCCTTTSSSPAIPRRSSTGSTSKGEPAPDPTCYLAAPAGTEPGGRPRGRRGALRARPHAVPAAAPRLVEDAARLPPGDPRQAEATARAWRTSRSASCSSGR